MLRDNVESVYNLISPPPSSTDKHRTYPQSKYNEESDTFMTCSKWKRSRATFGHPLGSLHPNPSDFLKKHSKYQIQHRPHIVCSPKVHFRPPIPKERGVFNHRRKDFIKENAVEMIHSVPKKLPIYMPRYVEKPNYGRIPKYLVKYNKILRESPEKANLDGSKKQALGTEPNTRRLEESEKQELIEGLKKKWQQVNTAYQKTSVTLDTWAKKARKERFEEQLMEIEKDIQTLSRRVVLVVDDGKSQSSSSLSSKRKHLMSHW